MTDAELYEKVVTSGRPLWLIVKGICATYELKKTLTPRQREILERFVNATQAVT